MKKAEQKNKNFTDIQDQGWISHLSSSLQNYALLARLDRPIGVWLLLLPCLFSTMLAVLYNQTVLLPVFYYGFLFAAGAIVMRAAGCVINDLWDKCLDQKVERTASRPLASGRISEKSALIFLIVLLLIGFLILMQLNDFVIKLGITSLIPVILYPLAKRLTHWPQLVLGLTFNWGALMGWAVTSGELAWPAFVLYAACVFWTLGYDTIYAYQDIKDDQKIGIRSTAILFGDKGKQWVSGFYLITSFLLVWSVQSLWLVLPIVHFIWQIRCWNPNDQKSSLAVFKANRDTGFLILFSIVLAFATGL